MLKYIDEEHLIKKYKMDQPRMVEKLDKTGRMSITNNLSESKISDTSSINFSTPSKPVKLDRRSSLKSVRTDSIKDKDKDKEKDKEIKINLEKENNKDIYTVPEEVYQPKQYLITTG